MSDKQRFLGGLLGANPVRAGSFADGGDPPVTRDFDNRSSTLALNTMNPNRTYANTSYKSPQFNGDGTKLVYGAFGDRLYTVNLGTAFDFDTGVNSAPVQVLDMALTNGTTHTCPVVSPNGQLIAHAYREIDTNSNNLFECSIGELTTAWDFTTYSALNVQQHPCTYVEFPARSSYERIGVIGWSPDSTKFYVVDNGESGATSFYQFSVDASTGAVTYISQTEFPSGWVRRAGEYWAACGDDHLVLAHRNFDDGAGTTANQAWVRIDFDGNGELTNGTWSYDTTDTTGLPNVIAPTHGLHYTADGQTMIFYVSTDGSYGGNISSNANYHSTWDVGTSGTGTARTTSNVGLVSLSEAGPEANGSNELTQINWGGIRGRDAVTAGSSLEATGILSLNEKLQSSY